MSSTTADPLPPFANEPVLELRRAAVRAGLGEALAGVDALLPLDSLLAAP